MFFQQSSSDFASGIKFPFRVSPFDFTQSNPSHKRFVFWSFVSFWPASRNAAIVIFQLDAADSAITRRQKAVARTYACLSVLNGLLMPFLAR
jgi:hypothetical protein